FHSDNTLRDVRTRGQNLSLDIRRGKLITLCRSEWPTFGVGWPTEGTFCLPIIAKALPAPAAPLVAPLGEPGRREAAAAPEPGGREAIAAPGPIENETDRKGPAGRTRGRTQALQRVHEDVWPKLRELYETGSPPIPHQFQPGDWVLVKCHRQENLEPRWKGPFQVILTTPMAIKVDGIATWIHCTHAKPVDPFSDLIGPPAKGTTWTIDRSKDDPLKITLCRKPPKP
ncbi:uncharacterized protein LOC102972161, partial [Panthera tigris]|uniref:uncharacterized protein LOC102972161 n=1 Tax=Panthera tigris TaxID=9694 RepID=UPI001C6F5EEC